MDTTEFINGLKNLVATLEAAHNEQSNETESKQEIKEEPKQEEKSVAPSATEQLTTLIEKLLAATQETQATTDTKNPTPPVAANTVKPSSEIFTPKRASEFLASFSHKG